MSSRRPAQAASCRDVHTDGVRMRRLPSASRLLLGLATLTALQTACNPSGGTTQPPTIDGGPDSGDPDGGSPLPAGTGVEVSVVAFGGSAPVAGVEAVFSDASGAVLGVHKTDANGKIFAAPAPAQVTVIVHPTQVLAAADIPFGALVTYTRVAEGDRLVVDATPQPTAIGGASSEHAKWDIALPLPPNGAASVHVSVSRDCAVTASVLAATQLRLQRACLGPQNTILAQARGEGAVALDYTWKKGIALPAAGSTTPVTVDQPFAFAGAIFSLRAANLPAGGTPHANFFLISDGIPFEARMLPLSPIDPAVGTSYLIPPAAFTTATQSIAWVELDSGGPAWSFQGALKRSTGTAAVVVDLGNPLPRITAANTQSVTPTQDTVTLESEAPLTVADGGYVRLDWVRRFSADEVFNYAWTFVVPPDTKTFTTPTIPDESLNGPEDYGKGFESALFVESSLVSSYADLKKVPVAALRRFTGPDPGRPLPVDGVVRMSGARMSPSAAFTDFLP